MNDIKQNSLPIAALPAVLAQLSRRVARVRRTRAPMPSARADASSPTRVGVSDRVVVTGAVTDAEYASWLDPGRGRGAAAAIGERRVLRRRWPTASRRARSRSSPGSAPGAICPTTASRRSARPRRRARSPPRSPTCSPIPTAADARRRGRAYAAHHSYAELARRLFEDVIDPATRPPQRPASTSGTLRLTALRSSKSRKHLSDARSEIRARTRLVSGGLDAGVEGAAPGGAAVFGGAALARGPSRRRRRSRPSQPSSAVRSTLGATAGSSTRCFGARRPRRRGGGGRARSRRADGRPRSRGSARCGRRPNAARHRCRERRA